VKSLSAKTKPDASDIGIYYMGRAGSPLRAAIANQGHLALSQDGVHGETRATGPNVARNCYMLIGIRAKVRMKN
jgi:hypothetical protein